ncbi:Glucose-fructose oxidoreductase domain-containing protein 1 [Fukomys damarensis]|uniref:Glucose-fructose oxidoreductase domain-containing protein 1 n=2 Tax=Fukomys damarensis TaxID=885580 RepID=A0A091DNU9_FUKDA|nr:Glucose-fructose oxidoreductase domain-containing protein 1 [Fukomys damarensis]
MLPGVGVFGTSLTARVIIPLLKDEGFAVKALWGRTQEEAEELAKEMSVPFYTSRIDEVLLHPDVDLVCINLPPPLTRQIAVKTLGRRYSVGGGGNVPVPKLPPRGRQLLPDRAQDCSSASFSRGGDISHVLPLPDHSFSGSQAKCSCPLEADRRREVVNFCCLIGQSPKGPTNPFTYKSAHGNVNPMPPRSDRHNMPFPKCVARLVTQANIALSLCIGKNVICDRTATPLDAFRMMSAAHYYPKLMSIMGNVLRFLPAFVRMKQLIEEGYVGELLVCEVQVHGGSLLGKKYNWSCDDLMGGGGLHSVGTYIIDLLTFLTGQKAVKVHGLLKTFVKQTDHIKGIRQITSDDFCTFQMMLEGGVCCTVTLNFNVPGEFKQDVTVVGAAGRLLAVGTDLYGQRNSAVEQELLLQDATPVNNSLLPAKAFSDIPAPYLRGTMMMMQAVRQAFQDQDDRRTWDGRPLTMAATFDDCLYALCVVDTIKRSSQTGEWQNIAVMTEEPDLSPAYLISEAMRRSRMSLYC